MTTGSRTHARTGISRALTRRRGAVLGVIAMTALLLSGCAPDAVGDPEPVETPSSSVAEPSEQPQASGPPSDVLFSLSATVRATDGTRITIGLVAHEPRVWSDPQIADLAEEFLERCASGTGLTPIDSDYLTRNGATLMRVDFISDSRDFQFASPIQLHFGNQFFPRAAFTDAVVTARGEGACYAGATWVFSNDAYAISAFETGSTTPDRSQWRFGSYGFQLLADSGTTIESCEKVITALGAATGVESVSGWDVSRDDGLSACGIGYIEDHEYDD